MDFNNNTDDAKNIQYTNRGVKEILKSLLQTPFGIHQVVVYPNKYDILREAYFYYIKKLLEDYNEIVIFLTYNESAEAVKNTLSSFLATTTSRTTTTTNTNVDNYSNSNNHINEKRQNEQPTPPQQKTESGIDVNRYIKNGSLVIIDSDEVFSYLKNDVAEKEQAITIKTNKKNNTENNNSLSSLLRMSITHAKKLKKEGITILADYGYLYKKNGFEYVKEFEKSIPYTLDSMNVKQICLYSQNDFFHGLTKQQKKEILDLHSRSIIMMDN